MSVKIISGEYRSRVLETPTMGESDAVRPTKAPVREAIFNALSSRIYFEDCTFVDLFSGCGALGLEALSRGAKHVTFIDTDTTYVRKNIELLQIPLEKYTLITTNALTHTPTEGYDVILADPPYGEDTLSPLLANVKHLGTADSLWALETETPYKGQIPFTLPEDMDILKQKKFGKSTLWILGNKG